MIHVNWRSDYKRAIPQVYMQEGISQIIAFVKSNRLYLP